jgi:hypothetical protein
MQLLCRLVENQDDIMCPNQGAHLSSCTKCAEGFEIISELANILKKQLGNLKSSYAVKYNTIDDASDSLSMNNLLASNRNTGISASSGVLEA